MRVVRDAVVVDLHHTSKADFATGIQRVVREVSRRWSEAADTVVVGWLPDFTAMRLMTPEEVARAFHGGPPVTSTPDVDEICVPWGGTFLLAEVAPEIPRSQRLSCMAQCSMTSFRLIVHDLIPVTAAETCVGLPGPFAQFLTAVRHARTIVAVSEASAEDFRGWLRMLAGTGLTGPDVYSVSLPTEVPDVEPGQVEEARQRLCVGTLPLVLVVGSHEPRKNHLTILHAAELLWREGLKFSLSFIGGNAWDSSPFEAALAASAESGRPVPTHREGQRASVVGRLPNGSIHRVSLPPRGIRTSLGRVTVLWHPGGDVGLRSDAGDRATGWRSIAGRPAERPRGRDALAGCYR